MSPFHLSRVSGEGARDYIHCPSCKEKATLSERGEADLPQDLHLGHEAEIAYISEKVESEDEYCEACGRTDSTGKAVKSIYARIVKAAIGRGPRQAFRCWSANDEDK